MLITVAQTCGPRGLSANENNNIRHSSASSQIFTLTDKANHCEKRFSWLLYAGTHYKNVRSLRKTPGISSEAPLCRTFVPLCPGFQCLLQFAVFHIRVRVTQISMLQCDYQGLAKATFGMQRHGMLHLRSCSAQAGSHHWFPILLRLPASVQASKGSRSLVPFFYRTATGHQAYNSSQLIRHPAIDTAQKNFIGQGSLPHLGGSLLRLPSSDPS